MSYIARALARARGLELTRHILIQPLAAQESTELGEKLEDYLRWHAIIIGDVPPSQFTDEQLEIFVELVGDYGKGFAMIGGRDSFERGLWAETPVAKMMPVDLSKSTGRITQEIQVTPTEAGRESELMRVGEAGEGASAAWSRLEKLPGASSLAGVKLGAEVLAATDRSQGARPLVVRQNYGKGRTLAIAFDTTWRWVLTPKDTAKLQRRFWRQVALYLAAPKGNVWIETDKSRYDLRELKAARRPVVITAGLEDSSGKPVTSVQPRVVLTTPDGDKSNIQMNVEAETERFRAELPAGKLKPTRQRPYVLTIEAKVDGKDVTSEYSFDVIHPDLDSLDTEANPAELDRISSNTRGEFRRLNQFGEQLEAIRHVTRPVKRLTPVKRRDLTAPLRWPAVAAIIALLCAEWAIRKRRGLI
ncbi:MAG: glutamine amidotransferase [Planctomycetota bacterium]